MKNLKTNSNSLSVALGLKIFLYISLVTIVANPKVIPAPEPITEINIAPKIIPPTYGFKYCNTNNGKADPGLISGK